MCIKSACSEHFPFVILADFSGYTLPEPNNPHLKKRWHPQKLESNLPTINFQGLFLLVSGMVKGVSGWGPCPPIPETRLDFWIWKCRFNIVYTCIHKPHPKRWLFFVSWWTHWTITQKTSKKMSPRILKDRFETTNSWWNISTMIWFLTSTTKGYVYTHLVDFYGKCRSIYLPYMDPI